jgi:hypothetical protein
VFSSLLVVAASCQLHSQVAQHSAGSRLNARAAKIKLIACSWQPRIMELLDKSCKDLPGMFFKLHQKKPTLQVSPTTSAEMDKLLLESKIVRDLVSLV